MNDSISDNCKDMRELLSAYHDAELDSNERTLVENHLSNCSDCRNELAAVESVVSSLKALPAVTLSKDFSADIESLIKRAEAEKAPERKVEDNVVSISTKTKKKRPMGLIAAAAAAAAVVMLMVAAYVHTAGGGGSVVATGPGGTEQTIASKQGNPVPSAADVGAQEEKPLIASSNTDSGSEEIGPGSTAVTSPIDNSQKVESSKSANKPATSRTEEAAHVSTPVIASAKTSPAVRHQKSVVHVDDLADNQALVAYSDTYDENEVFENSGMSTDEDGLYAIKM